MGGSPKPPPMHPHQSTEGDGAANGSGVSRRSFLQTLGVSAAASSLSVGVRDALAKEAPADGPEMFGPGPKRVVLTVNAKEMPVTIEPSTTLLDALRMGLGLTGSKEICDRGSCGGCSVIIDGRLHVSCMMLATDAVGAKVQTIEGLSDGESLHPIQEAFVKHDALQCGFCTPGLVMACKSLLDATPKPSLSQIKKGLAGNICRCGTYTNIFNACLEVSGQPVLKDA